MSPQNGEPLPGRSSCSNGGVVVRKRSMALQRVLCSCSTTASSEGPPSTEASRTSRGSPSNPCGTCRRRYRPRHSLPFGRSESIHRGRCSRARETACGPALAPSVLVDAPEAGWPSRLRLLRASPCCCGRCSWSGGHALGCSSAAWSYGWGQLIMELYGHPSEAGARGRVAAAWDTGQSRVCAGRSQRTGRLAAVDSVGRAPEHMMRLLRAVRHAAARATISCVSPAMAKQCSRRCGRLFTTAHSVNKPSLRRFGRTAGAASAPCGP